MSFVHLSAGAGASTVPTAALAAHQAAAQAGEPRRRRGRTLRARLRRLPAPPAVRRSTLDLASRHVISTAH